MPKIMGFTMTPHIVRGGQFIKRNGQWSPLKTEANADIIWILLVQFKSHHVKTQSGFSMLWGKTQFFEKSLGCLF